MKLNLPIVGKIKTGRDAEPVEIIKEVQKVSSSDLLGGFLNMNQAPQLSGEKSISTKILQANKGWVYRNNDAIAQEVAKIDFELYTIGLSEGEIVYNEVTSHPLLDLLDKPNEENTKTDLIYIVQSHRKLSGDAFILKVRNGSQTVALRTLPPDKITLNLQPPTASDPTIIESYVYRDVIDGNRIEVVYQPEEIIHIKRPNPNNPFRGLGAVEALADTIDLDNLTTETTKRFFENGAITNFVLTTDQKVNDEQLERLNAQLRSRHAGPSNAYKAMILGGGLEPKDISYSNKELEFLKQLEWYRDKIMYGFGNTKASLGMVDDVNRASFEGSSIGWLRNTVKPDMIAIVEALNEFLVPEFGEKLVLGFKEPIPEDRSDDVAEVKDLYPIGVLTLDEARDMVDLDPATEGGDQFRKPGDNPLIAPEEAPDEENS